MPYFGKKYYPVRNVLFFFVEGLCIFCTINLVYLGFSGWEVFREQWLLDVARAGLVTLVFQFCLYLLDLYEVGRKEEWLDTLTRMIQAFGVCCIILGILYWIYPTIIISNRIFWSSYAVILILLFGWRSVYALLLQRRLFTRPLLLIGTGRLAATITKELVAHPDRGYWIAAFIGRDPPDYNPESRPCYPLDSDIHDLCRKHGIRRVVVALDDRRGQMPTRTLLSAKVRGMVIEDGISFLETITGKILVENVNPAWLIFSDGFKKSLRLSWSKRLLDILLSLAGLILSSPITLLVAACIKLESPGPVFYLQERVGAKDRTFRVIKFRSMRQDAEKDGAAWAKQDDPRVTRVGRIIRKTRIDEIPQMLNILKGEMSFVGPRPERPMFVEQLTRSIPYYALRHTVKPGLTGWAQVCYPYGASEEDALRKLEYDLYYIKNLTLFLDLLIVFRTVKTVLLQRGSR